MITTAEILKFNPYDIEFRTLSSIAKSKREDFFFENLFIETIAFKKHQNELMDAISPLGGLFKNIVILHGYSGNGKTTFLNWFKRKLTPDYYFDIFNINDFPASTKENSIHQSVFVKIKELIENNYFMSLQFYEEHSTFSKPFLINSQIEYLAKFNKLFNEREEAKINGIELTNVQRQLKIHIELFEEVFSFESTLFLYFLEVIVRNYNENITSFTICFDNLDEVGFEYMTEKLWIDFTNVRSNLISFFDVDSISFNFPNKVIFLLVFREANLLVNAAHHEERISSNSRYIKLLLSDTSRNKPSSGKKIIDARLLYLRRSRNISKDNVYKVASTIVNEGYTNRVFLPLFNYDYRKLMNMVIEIAEPRSSEKSEIIYPRLYKQVKKTSPYIARGLFFNRIINYLLKRGYIKELAKKPDHRIVGDRGFCRPSRLLLTVIFNLTYPSGLPNEEYMLHLEKPKKVNLYNVIKEYFKLYSDVDSFFKDLTLLFNIKEGSWAHLVSLYNKKIDSESNYKLDFKNEIKNVKNWKNELITDIELNRSLSEEKKLQLHINASGYIYLRYLITHFEYFVILNNYRNGTSRRSLVETFLSLDYNPSKMKFEFEILISEIINKLKRYKGNICNFLTNVIINEKQITPYSYLYDSNYSFSRSDEHGTSFYLTRIITTHISYLDELRHYMFFGAKKRTSKKAQQHNSSIRKLNKIMIHLMEDYLDVLEETNISESDKIAKASLKNTGERIKYVKKGDLNKWQPIVKSNAGDNNASYVKSFH